ncbi:MAG: IclR family transcriptional regulator [Chloroflexota bacterium]
MTANTPYPGTQAVVRAISVLKAFTDEHPEWTLTPLAREIGLNKATTYRLLTALESEALIVRDSHSEKYRLGPGMVALGGRALRANNLRAVSRGELETLAEETNETASLEILQDHEVLILHEVTGRHVMSGGRAIGTRWAAHATSTGKVLLAALPSQRLVEILPSPLPTFTPHTIADLQALQADLAQVRERGYAVADQELEVGLLAIGAPLRNHDGEVVAAISVAGPTLRLTPEQIPDVAALVREAAARISRQLGYQALDGDSQP